MTPYYCHCFFCLLSHVIRKMISWWKNCPNDNEYNFENCFVAWRVWHSLYTDWFLTWQWFMIYQRKHPANENALQSLCIYIMSFHLIRSWICIGTACFTGWAVPTCVSCHGTPDMPFPCHLCRDPMASKPWTLLENSTKQHFPPRNTPGRTFTWQFGKHSSTTALFIIMYRQRERERGENIQP